MKKIIAVLILLASCNLCTITGQETILDFKLGPFVKLTRLFLSNLIKPKTFESGYRVSALRNKTQPFFAGNFFCNVSEAGGRSKVTPKLVHKLTPGDIDVIGGIGDSLTAANGAFAVESLQTTIENRGVSWSAGGLGNWRKFLTLPNILKVFNPNLYGYSEAENSLGFQRGSRFNVGEPTGTSMHIIRQARNLVKRMRSDYRVDIKNHWKLITIMIGSNDFCLDICYFDDHGKILDDGARNMIQVLRILRENLPRTIINVLLPVDVRVLYTFTNVSDECKGFHHAECACLASLSQQKNREKMGRTISMWKKRLVDVVNMEEFHNRDDFEVTLIPFSRNVELPQVNNSSDYSYLSHDCFHFSQKMHSIWAFNTWNAMLTPESERPDSPSFKYSDFKCPTIAHPYLRTRRN